MGSLAAWCLLACALPGATPDAAILPTDSQALAVDPSGLPLDTLLTPEDRQNRFGVVVMAYPGVEDGARLEKELTTALLEWLGKPYTVGSVRAYGDVDKLRRSPDEEVARTVCHELNVNRLLLARLMPAPAGPNPTRVMLTVIDSHGGRMLLVEPAALLVVPRPEEKPPPRVWEPPPSPPPAPPTERVWTYEPPPDTPAPPPPTEPVMPPMVAPVTPPVGGPDALAEFKRRALTLRLVEDEDGLKAPVLHLERNGQVLTDAQLKELGAPPAPDVERPSDATPGSSRLLTALLVPGGPLALAAGGALGALVSVGTCASVGALSGVELGAQQVLLGALGYGLLGLFLCAPFTGAGGALLGLLVGAPLTAWGAWRLSNQETSAEPEVEKSHPYLAFVTRHNRALARELGVPTASVGKKYFPTQRRG